MFIVRLCTAILSFIVFYIMHCNEFHFLVALEPIIKYFIFDFEWSGKFICD